VDFTNSILEAETLYDRSMGKAGILRLLYRIIREAIGDESYFLGCCVPYESAFDLVDAVRTTADIQIRWSCVLINMTSASARWWMHRKLWNNDPDFLVVRGPETSGLEEVETSPLEAGKYDSGPLLSRREAMTLALALYMTGGDLILSDVFDHLNDSGRQILHDLLELEPLEQTARPVDLFTCECGEIPAFWWDAGSGKLAVFNWSENIRRMEIVPERFGAVRVGSAFWNPKQTESPKGGKVTVVLAPHEATGIVLDS
jgi:alpha-galactosidase